MRLANWATAQQPAPTGRSKSSPAISLRLPCGEVHSIYRKSDGSLWGMGSGEAGQLGDGTWSRTNRPKQIVSGGVTAVAGGGYHSLFLKSDGSLWTMGFNYNGALGDGTTTDTNRPEQIVSGGVVAIGAGGYHSLFLKSDGRLWAMGSNDYGQLGDDTFAFGISRPVPIVPFPPVPAIIDWNFSGTTVSVQGTNGLAGGTYYSSMSTNLALPASKWSLVATNVPVANGAFTLTSSSAFDPKAAQRFYRLQLLR
jgi:hypothetical protein